MSRVDAVSAEDGIPSHRDILYRVAKVEADVDGLKQTITENRTAAHEENLGLHGLLSEVLKRLGEPASGDNQRATGLYWKIEAIDGRLNWFERARERFRGGAYTLVGTLAVVGPLIWFLAGGKLTHLLHG